MDGIIEKLDEKVKRFDKRNHVSSEKSICDKNTLVQNILYVFAPLEEYAGKKGRSTQDAFKKEFSKYIEKRGLNFVVTSVEFCDDRECHGHYIDPFEVGFASKKVHVNKFPEDISGGYIHILKPSVKIMANQLLYTF